MAESPLLALIRRTVEAPDFRHKLEQAIAEAERSGDVPPERIARLRARLAQLPEA